MPSNRVSDYHASGATRNEDWPDPPTMKRNEGMEKRRMKLRQILVAAIAVLFVLPLTAATTWYVNGSSGSDSYTGRSESSAKATIQAAIDASSAGDTILVAPGTYTPIRTNGKRITIRSTSGAANTIIDGGGTSMCANLGHDVRATRLVGFTLQNGNSGGYEAGGTLGGTAVCCIYRNNRGKNYAGSSAAATSAVINCLAYGNVFESSWGGGTFNNCAVSNCTIVANTGYALWDGKAWNTIVWGNTKDVYTSSERASDPVCVQCNISEDPKFVDAESGDYRLTADSPCIDAGDNSYAPDDADLDGNVRIVNGTVDLGCYEYGSSTPDVAYCVIDLSAGPSASFYPVTYLAEPPSGGFNVDAYKTTKLVLRRIEPGSFKLFGSHDVTLTKPFFIGVFEVTQKQWELVMGSNPSTCNNGSPKCPVDHVSYDMIRGSSQGARWPTSNSVDASSFLGKLRARSGVEFDLPTSAQWEYACRAGTSTTYSYGDNANGDYMWYAQNSSYTTHNVGTKLPNAWGLYDMHGNVWEWSLDLVENGGDNDSYYRTHGTDPVGPESGNERPFSGGGCRNSARWSTCVRSNGPSSTTYGSRGEGDELGFRLALISDVMPSIQDVSTCELVVGQKAEVDTGFVGLKNVRGLPQGLTYNAKTGKVSGVAKKAGEYAMLFNGFALYMFSVREEEVSVGCEGLSGGTFITGVAGNADGIPLEIESETGVKSVSVTKLPAGMKYDAKTGLITGAPTKAGDYNVVVTVTTKSGAKRTETISISVAVLPETAVGTFNGFVKANDGVENIGTFQLTATDAGKLTAKVITADGTYSFSGTCWDAVEGDTYSVTLATKKGETLALELDSSAGWDANQLTGAFSAVAGRPPYQVVARRNAFGKTWYLAADGGIEGGWTLSYAANSKVANLTVTLNADGSLKLAGKLGTLSVNASGYADVTGIANGVIFADFAPVVSLKEGKTTIKKVLSIRSNLWFDRSNDHVEGVGSAVLLH